MAYDPQLKSKVRATYESNNLSFVRIHEMFSHEISSNKTIEGWANRDKTEGSPWIKNRYGSLREAIDAVVEKNIENLQGVATEAIKKQMEVPVELVENEAYIRELGVSEVKKSLTKHGLVEMMEENLLDAYKLARGSGHINTKATFQMMAKSVMESKYGKNINIGAADMSSITNEEITQMSQQQLIELANDLKE